MVTRPPGMCQELTALTVCLLAQEKKKAVPKVTPMAFGRRMGEDNSPRSVSMLTRRYYLQVKCIELVTSTHVAFADCITHAEV